ncbi:MAG: Ig-like domain-containing protein, partial [Chloroflexota bacterium]|nr:Ig-like domain-containing protein [Chloroflexota bacterium]
MTAAKALRIVGSIPGDQTDGVPRNTGIEVTFDQAGVTAAAMQDHFSISPKASGRFEVHGRTVAFVPAKPLKARTVYTVTVTKGVPLSGTGQSLGADYRFQFETKGTGPEVGLRPFDLLTDTAVRDAPVVLAYFWDDKDDGKTAIPKTVPVTVHRLDGLTAATAAYTKLANAPDWTRSAGAPIATSQLTRVLKADLRTHRIVDEEGGVREAWLRLPDPLARGWYVLTLTYGGAKSQVLLQVTDLAAYAMVTTSKTVVWVNSVRSGRPVAGATVSLSGTSLGRTDEDGLRVAVTPASFADSRHVTTPFVTVRDADGREVFLPIGGGGLCGKCDTGMISDGGSAAADAWWSVLMLDRQTLRSTDRANVWGIVRARDGGALPASVEIRLIASESWEPAGATPVVVERPRLAPTGMFTADIEFADVPVGYYQLELRANGETIENTWVQVGPIVKPAYTLEVTVRDRAVLSGSSVTADVTARFFEGTPVAGVDLRFVESEYEDEDAGVEGADVRTSADGTATGNARVSAGDDDYGQWSWQYVGLRPTLPEEAEIGGGTHVSVFRSTALLDADATIDGKRLAVRGALHDVDFERMAAAVPNDWEVDPRGAPRAGGKVRITVDEKISVRKQIGTGYDSITKTTSPVYEYSTKDGQHWSRTVTTGSDGTFRLALDVPGGSHGYEVTARYVDEGGRAIRTEAWAAGAWEATNDEWVHLENARTVKDDTGYAIGDTIKLEVQGGTPKPTVDRYLFTVSSRGFRLARIQSGPTLTIDYRAAWIPSAAIRGVRFNGSAYDVVNDPYLVRLALDDRSLGVTLQTDATRYEPGDKVSVAVRTTGPDGGPVSATVVVRAIDEKLYAIGAAVEADLREALYESVGDGVMG